MSQLDSPEPGCCRCLHERGRLAAVSIRVVLIGGAHDGREFYVPDDDRIITSGVLALPELDDPSPADLVAGSLAGSTFTLLNYRWNGTVREDGARQYRLDP
jgi:hypothetical protein